MAKIVVLITLLVVAAGCRSSPSEKLSGLTEEFVNTTLSFSPAAATGAGLHEFQKQKLDDMLDDMSAASLDKQQKFYAGFQERLKAVPVDKLTAEERADVNILEDQTALALLDLTSIHTALHNPTMYVETLGNALFNPWVLEYAPKPQRIRSIISRLEKVPLYLDQASSNLVSAPPVWVQVAIDENQGNIDLVDKTIRAGVPAELNDAYNKVAGPAIGAMNKFQTFLKTSLGARNNYSWQLGQRPVYAQIPLYPAERRRAGFDARPGGARTAGSARAHVRPGATAASGNCSGA